MLCTWCTVDQHISLQGLDVHVRPNTNSFITFNIYLYHALCQHCVESAVYLHTHTHTFVYKYIWTTYMCWKCSRFPFDMYHAKGEFWILVCRAVTSQLANLVLVDSSGRKSDRIERQMCIDKEKRTIKSKREQSKCEGSEVVHPTSSDKERNSTIISVVDFTVAMDYCITIGRRRCHTNGKR